MWRSGTGAVLALAIAVPVVAGDSKDARPRLALRAAPRIGIVPASILFTAELVGGEAVEEFYCPGVEWNWGDGETSFHEADCPPFGPGVEFNRRFSARHFYRQSGSFEVRLTLRRSGRAVAASRASIMVQSRNLNVSSNLDGF